MKRKLKKKTKRPISRSEDYYFRLGYAFHTEGDLEQAAEYYIRSIEINPTPNAHTFLANVLRQFGELDAAIEECKVALELDPQYGNALNDLGAYLMEKRKYKEAEKFLVKACKSKNYDNKEFAHFNLARYYLRKGMLRRATFELKESTKINPTFQQAKEFLNQVESQLH